MSILSQILGCSIKDLIEDDPAIINYEKVAEECKDDPLYSLNQVFSPKNTEYLRNYFYKLESLVIFRHIAGTELFQLKMTMSLVLYK